MTIMKWIRFRWDLHKKRTAYKNYQDSFDKNFNQEQAGEFVMIAEMHDYDLAGLEKPGLIREADRWDVEIKSEDWKDSSTYGRPYLTFEVRSRIRKRIREERRLVVKEWVQIAVPFMGFVLAALAIIYR